MVNKVPTGGLRRFVASLFRVRAALLFLFARPKSGNINRGGEAFPHPRLRIAPKLKEIAEAIKKRVVEIVNTDRTRKLHEAFKGDIEATEGSRNRIRRLLR